MVDKAIDEGKLLPKQKEAALAFATNLTGTIKFGDSDVSATKVFSDFLDAMPKKVDLTENGTTDAEGNEKPEFDSADDEVHARAEKMLADDKDLDYASARTLVLSADEALKTRYFHMEE
jgi:hypothetical protein